MVPAAQPRRLRSALPGSILFILLDEFVEHILADFILEHVPDPDAAQLRDDVDAAAPFQPIGESDAIAVEVGRPVDRSGTLLKRRTVSRKGDELERQLLPIGRPTLESELEQSLDRHRARGRTERSLAHAEKETRPVTRHSSFQEGEAFFRSLRTKRVESLDAGSLFQCGPFPNGQRSLKQRFVYFC